MESVGPFKQYVKIDNSTNIDVSVDPDKQIKLLPMDLFEMDVLLRVSSIAKPGDYRITVGIYNIDPSVDTLTGYWKLKDYQFLIRIK